MRPTGRLHIGNYFGALQNWVKLQDDPSNECFFFIADWHSLTSDYADTSQIAQNTIEVMIDFLAGGLDPSKSVIFLQSSVPEHAELHLLLSMITPLGWLERVPTYKEQIENIKGKDLHTYGFLGYPVLQTSDIVIYGEPGMSLAVPVGEDQVAHVELSREVVRHFNLFNGRFVVDEDLRQENHAHLVGQVCHALQIPSDDFGLKAFPLDDATWSKFVRAIRERFLAIGFSNALELLARATEKAERRVKLAVGDREADARILGVDPEQWKTVKIIPVLTEPDVMLTQAKRVPGTDGRKMSKSYGNAIELGESDESIRAKTKAMITDPARKRRTDPGNPDICPVFDWHKLFSPPETLSWASVGCKTAGIGCIECKSAMADNLIKWITPIRARRLEFAAEPKRVLELIDAGSKRARETAQATMERVREAVFGWKAKRESVSGSVGTSDAKQRGAGD